MNKPKLSYSIDLLRRLVMIESFHHCFEDLITFPSHLSGILKGNSVKMLTFFTRVMSLIVVKKVSVFC